MWAKPSEYEVLFGATPRRRLALTVGRRSIAAALVAALLLPTIPARAQVVDTTVAPVDTTVVPEDTSPVETTPPDTTVAESTPSVVTSTVSLIVKLVDGLDAAAQDAAIARHGGTEVSAIPTLRLHVVEVPAVDVDAVMAAYRADGDVVSVSLDRVREVEGAASDPGYGSQWGLRQIGWDQVHGEVELASGVRVAVLDTGVAEIGELSGRVGDGFSAFGTDPRADANGHGTEMASIVAAATDNGAGIAGVAYGDVTVLPVQVLDGNGEGSDSDIIEGVVWAVDNGADVILMAFSNPGYSPALQDALNYAWWNGVVLVAAAGNDGSTSATYPAGSSKVIGVGGSTASDTVWSGSNQSTAVYLTAPAVGISAISATGDLVSVTGTSASAAIVAGAAAVLRGADTSASNAVIVGRLARNAEPLADGTLGNGRVSLSRAVADTSTEGVTPMGVAGSGGPVVGPYTTSLFRPSTVTTPTVTEGAASSTTSMTFTVTPAQYSTGNGSNLNTATTLYWRVNGGTATAGTAGGTCGAAGIDYIPPATSSRSTSSTSTFDIVYTICGDGLGEGDETIIVQVSDDSTFRTTGGFTTLSRTGTITNDDANAAPVNSVPSSQTMNEDATLTFSSANSNVISISDADAGSASVTATLSATNGTVTFNGSTAASVAMTGTITAINTALNGASFTPTANFFGTASVSIATNDGGNTGSGGAQSDSDSISVTVNDVNDTPSFTKGADQTVLEDSGAASVANWATSISDGPNETGAVTFTVTTTNDALFSVLPAVDSSGTLTFAPAVNANGSATVSVTAVDAGSASSAAQTFTTTVTAVNDAPSFVKGADQTVDEDSGAQSVNLWATSISAGPNETGRVTFTVSNNNTALFSVQPAVSASDATNPGQLTFTPAVNAFGSATVSVTAYDADGVASSSESFTITVTNVNDAPSFTLGADQLVNENSGARTSTGWVTSISAGPDETGSVTFALTTDNDALFAVLPAVNSSGDLTYTPATDTSGVATVTITASDPDGATSASQTFTITVSAVNDAPSFLKGTDQTVEEDSAATTISEWATLISAGPADESGQTVSFTITTDNDALFAVLPAVNSSGDLSFTPAANAFGLATVSVTAVDSGGASSDAQTFTITVTGINDAPSFVKGANQTVEVDDGAVSVTGWATGVSAGPGETDQTVTFTVDNDNNALFSVQPTIDADGDLTFTLDGVATGTATVTVSLADDGSDVSPNVNTSAEKTFTITVSSANLPPSFTPGDNEMIDEDAGEQTVTEWASLISPGAGETGTVTFTVTTDNDALFSSLPVISAAGDLTYTPAANANGSATVEVTAVDDKAATSGTETFTIFVNAVNDVPSFVKGLDRSIVQDAGAQTVTDWATGISAGPANESDQTVTFTVTTDNDALFSVVPTINADGDLTYTPDGTVLGSATVSVTISDSGSGVAPNVKTSGVQTFTITILVANTPPTFTAGDDQTVAEDAGGQSVTDWATDILAGVDETGTVTFTVTNDNNALFSTQPAVSSSGTLTYTPAANAFGSATVSVTAVDAQSATSATETFTITVTAVNDAPSFVKGTNRTVAEDAGATTVTGWATSISAGPGETGTVTFGLTTDNDGLFAVLPAVDSTGELSFTPAANANGSATVTITATDPEGASSAAQTFTITVTAVNDAPSFVTGANQTVDEDAGAQSVTGWATGISAGPSDESAQTVSFNVSNNNTALFSSQPAVSSAGVLTFTPAANANGSATVTLSISDNGSGTAPNVNTSSAQTFTITVTAVNDAPSFVKGANVSVAEDSGAYGPTAFATSISAGPSDESTQTVSFTVTNDNNGLFSTQPAVAANGRLSFTPAANANGSATVSVTVVDTGSGTAPNVNSSVAQTFTITVTAVNDAPSFVKGADRTVDEDSGAASVTGWATAIAAGPSNESDQTVTFTVTNDNTALFSTQPAVSSAGVLTFTPAANANGSATVSVTAVDSGSGTSPNVNSSAAQTFVITVTAVNDVPSFVKGANVSVAEDSGSYGPTAFATSISAGPSDESTQTVSFTVTNDNNGLFSTQPTVAANGRLSFTPAANANGSATVSVTAIDTGSGTAPNVNSCVTQTFTITVTAVNDAPSFVKGADRTVDEDSGAASITGWATSIAAGPSNESDQTVTFTVTNDNTALFSTQPAVSSAGVLTFTPAANANGSATVSVTAVDSGSGTSPNVNSSVAQTFTITVTAVNDAPSFVKGADVSVAEDSGSYGPTAWATTISAGPGETGTVTFTVTNDNNSLFSTQPAVASNGRLTFTVAANKFGTASVSVTAVDNGSGTSPNVNSSAAQTFTITVSGVNDVPSFTKGANQTVDEDAGAQSVTGWATSISAGPDESDQTVSFNVSNNNTALFSTQPAVSSAGVLSYTPAANANGSATVTLTISDNGSGTSPNVNTSAVQTFTITVTAVNDAPSFVKGADQSVNEDAGAQSVTGWATSISAGPGETGTVTFTVTNDNTALFGTQPAVSSAGVLTYTPAANANGSATVSVTAVDTGSLTSTSETFTIFVNAVNDVPSFVKGANQTVNEDAAAQSVTGWATSISAGPSNESTQTVTFTATNTNNALFSTQPAVSSAGVLTYTPAANANGSATVTVTISDDGSGTSPNVNTSASQTFTITVTAINDAPSFTKGADQSVNEDAGAQSVTGWATSISTGPSDESAQTVSFSVVTNSNTALFSTQPAVSSAGVLSYTPAANATGSATITLRITDNGSSTAPNVNASATQDFVITVNPVNDAPVATAQSTSVNEDATVTLTLAGTDVETAAANLTEIIVSLPTNGELRDGSTTITAGALPYTLPSTGQVTYVPNANYSGSDSFTFSVLDRGQPDNCAALLIATTCSAALTSVSAATVTLSVNEVNDAPSVNLPTNADLYAIRFTYDANGEIILDADGNPVTVSELLGSGLQVTEISSATVVDAAAVVTDDSTDFKGGSLTVSSGGHSTEGSILGDRLGVRNEGSGAGQIGVSSRDITYGGVVIGSFTGGGVQGGSLQPLVITFNSRANDPAVSKAAVQALLRNITFWNDVATVKNPAETRVLSFTLNDGGLANDPTTQATARKMVYVQPISNAPVIVLGSGPFTVLEQAPPFALAPSATLTDEDTSNFSGATLTVDYTTAVSTLNQITIRDGAGNGGDPVNIDGGFLYYGNSKIGSWRNGDNGAALIVRFSARTVSLTQVQDVIRAIMFANTSDAPMAQRTLRFNLDDGTGVSTTPRPTVVVNITPVNDAPTLTLGRSSASYTEDATPAVLSPQITVSDPDGTSLSSPSLTVRFVANGLAEDELGILSESVAIGSNKIGVSGSQVLWNGAAIGTWSGGTAGTSLVVSLSGSISASVAEALAKNITYRNSSQAPSTTARTVGFVLADGSGGSSTEAQLTLSVIAVNDAPVNTVPTGATLAEDATVTLNTASGWVPSIADIDAGTGNLSVTLTATDGTVTFDGTTAASVTKTGTLTALNSLLNGVVFTPDLNYFGTTTVTMLTSDLGNSGTPGARTDSDPITIVVTPVNDAPEFTVGTSPSVLEDSGANTLSAWVSPITPGPREGSTGQTVTFSITGNSNPGLFSTAPTIASDGTLTFIPTADLFGSATITVKATDDGPGTSPDDNESDEQTFTITIEPVNDAPSFTAGADQTVDEDTLQEVVAGWATAMSAGPANESDQTVSFSVSNDNTALFSEQPAVDGSGELTFTPAPDAFGSATVSVKAVDDGNSNPTKTGDTNESLAQTFVITVDPVNDEPSFVKGADVTVDEDSGASVSAAWATGIDKGDGESSTSQVVSFEVVADDPSLFSVQPAIDTTGGLTFTPAGDEFGTATVTVTPVDDGNTDKALDDNEGPEQTFTITIDPVNDEPSFIKGADQEVDEDTQAHIVSGWATATSTGPANESDQSVTFTVTNDNNAMFSVQPAISPDGELTYTTATNAFGEATVIVVMTDDGNTGKPGEDNETDPQTFVISFASVNDAPSFVLGTDPSVLEDAGPTTLSAWATSISSGPANEADQTVSFEVTDIVLSNTNYAELFATEPAIDGDGNLTFEPAANAFGDALVTVKAVDSGPGAGLDINESAEQSFTITVEPVNDPPFIGLMVGAETIEPPIQYSDSITDAAIAYGDIDTAVDEDNIWTKYTFIPAGGVTASEEIDGLPIGLDLVSVGPPSALSAQGQVKLSGRMMVPPGTYTISIGIDDGDPLGALEDSFSIEYEVITETIDTSYVGDLQVLTASPTSNTASVLLQAQLTQKDIELGSYFVGTADQIGVRWQVFAAGNSTATPDFVFPPMDQNPVLVDGTGGAQLQVPLKVGGYRLKVILAPNTYWSLATSNETSVNVVLGASNRRLTGGGWITDAGSSNRRGSFTFSVTALRTGAVSGNLSYTYRDSSGFTWKVTATSWQPGSLTYYTDPGRATLQGKAMVQKINSLGVVVGVWRDYSIAVSIYDGARLRVADRFSILVTASDGSVWRQVPAGANVLAGEGVRLGGGSISVYRW